MSDAQLPRQAGSRARGTADVKTYHVDATAEGGEFIRVEHEKVARSVRAVFAVQPVTCCIAGLCSEGAGESEHAAGCHRLGLVSDRHIRAAHTDGLSLQALAAERLTGQGDDVGHAGLNLMVGCRSNTATGENQCVGSLEVSQAAQPVVSC